MSARKEGKVDRPSERRNIAGGKTTSLLVRLSVRRRLSFVFISPNVYRPLSYPASSAATVSLVLLASEGTKGERTDRKLDNHRPLAACLREPLRFGDPLLSGILATY